jgi:hypothetical protein
MMPMRGESIGVEKMGRLEGEGDGESPAISVLHSATVWEDWTISLAECLLGIHTSHRAPGKVRQRNDTIPTVYCCVPL